MKPLQHTVIRNAIPPAAIKDDAAFVSNVIDTNDLAYGEFHAVLGTIDATAAVLRIMESDTVTDAVTLGGSPTEVRDVTPKPGASDGGKVIVLGVDFVARPKRKRYIQLQATAGDGAAGTYLAATFVGVRSGNTNTRAADRGALVADYV